MPDDLTPAGIKQWTKENNIPSAVGAQLGGDANASFFLGSTMSGELQWVLNLTNGELTYFWNNTAGPRFGSIQNGVAAHGGITLFQGASNNSDSIAGASQFTSLDGGGATYFGSVNWSRAYKYVDTNGDGYFNLTNEGGSEPLGRPFIDPVYDRTVDAYSLNVGRSANVPIPGVLPGGVTHGLGDANELATFPVGQTLYNTFVRPVEIIYSWFQ